jgi:hypothetical protein
VVRSAHARCVSELVECHLQQDLAIECFGKGFLVVASLDEVSCAVAPGLYAASCYSVQALVFERLGFVHEPCVGRLIWLWYELLIVMRRLVRVALVVLVVRDRRVHTRNLYT